MDPEKTPDKNGGRQALVVVGVLGAIAVNIAAFMLSADAINAVAEAAGISKNIAWAQVLAVDGLMVTGTVVFIANKLRGRSVTYPLVVLCFGVLLSIWCNALHAKAGGGHIVHLGDHAKMGVSAIPAVSLALSFHLIADMVKDSLGIAEKTSAGPADERLPERPLSVRPDASGTSAGASAVPSVNRPPQRLTDAHQTRPADGRQTLAGPSVQTAAQTTQPRPQTTARKTRPAASSAPAKPAKSPRETARELLKANPDMAAADLAEQLGKARNSGHVRTMKSEILAELRDAGEIPSVRAIGA